MSPSLLSTKAARTFRAAALLALTALGACEQQVTVPQQPQKPGPVTVSMVEVIGVVEIEKGLSRQLVAKVHGSNGTILTDRHVEWTTSDPAVAVVSNGVVFGQSAGTAVITATVEGKSASTPVYILPVTVAEVQVQPATATLSYGQVQHFGAMLRSREGQQIYDRAVTWTSSDTSIARVDATGKVSARRSGTVEIVATSEGKSARATVRVTAARADGVWQLFAGNLIQDAYTCTVSGVELKIEQQGDSIYGEAYPGAGGVQSWCTRIAGQTPTRGVSTPMPPVGPFTGKVVDNQIVIRFEFYPWELKGTVMAASLYGKSQYVGDPIDGVAPVYTGSFTANRKP